DTRDLHSFPTRRSSDLSQFEKIKQSKSPFGEKINLGGRQATWLHPVMVAEVMFAEWTDQGRLRQPAFKGLRTDKIPQELTVEGPDRKSTRLNSSHVKIS